MRAQLISWSGRLTQMAWQDLFPLPGARIDAEEERELRLVAQARGGADWALSALVARYQPTVSRYLSRLTGSVEQSRVLAERVFRRMDQRIRGPQGGKQLRLWLLRTSTELGLDALREPRSHMLRALTGPHGPVGLLPGKADTGPLRRRLGGLGEMTSKTSRQVRKLIWSASDDRATGLGEPQALHNGQAFHHDLEPNDDPFPDLDPREALRFKMIRAVLAELPYGDAQCLALHLVAGLNQAEVARALGITGSASRRRVVHGLQLFAMRYEAAAASLRLPPETIQERAAPVFETPTLAQEFVEPVGRLSNGAGPHAGATMPPSPHLNTEPPRIVPANPHEMVEDASAEELDQTIPVYDLANEATVVIDPIVVEADSTLPVPFAHHPEEPGAPPAGVWFDRELVAIPEPQITVGSIPLGDIALTIELVDEPLDLPPALELASSPVMTDDLASEPSVTILPSGDDLAPTVAMEGDATDAESDVIVLVDLEAMSETPLSNTVSDPAEEMFLTEPVADFQSDDAGDGTGWEAVAVAAALSPDDLVTIADARDPDVATPFSSVRPDAVYTGPAREAVATPGDVISDSAQVSPATPMPPAREPVIEAPEPARIPRRVPVLTDARQASQSVTPAPRRVPVLTSESESARGNESKHGATIAKRARVERVSHR